MNAKLLERLAIGKGIGTRHISFKRYTALGMKPVKDINLEA
jgi:hypothetical protein